MVTKKKSVDKTQWPKVNKGTHLTVYTYEDGSTKLEWDDEALLKEVQEATKSVKTKPAVIAKSKKKVPAKQETIKKPTAKKTVKKTKDK